VTLRINFSLASILVAVTAISIVLATGVVLLTPTKDTEASDRHEVAILQLGVDGIAKDNRCDVVTLVDRCKFRYPAADEAELLLIALSGSTPAENILITETSKYFEFVEERVVDADNDGLPEYRTRTGVYFVLRQDGKVGIDSLAQ
jgi:hypothetical protein